VNEHFKKFQPQIDLASMPSERRIEVVEAFVRQVLNIARITTDWRFIHFSPQLWFLCLGNRVVPRHVVPMGSDDSFIQEALSLLGLPSLPVPRHNPSPIDLTASLTSRIVREFVQQLYADDFAYMRADTRLAPLTRCVDN
jgi:hypothetical protein